MSEKSHKTAVVIIPPEEVCAPIQNIREIHDRQYHRWMPHINLIYPFKPKTEFPVLTQQLSKICEKMFPFTLKLSEFCFFRHSNAKFTLWLAPKPKEKLVQFQSQFVRQFSECDDLNRKSSGYTPHLTVGQAESQSSLMSLRKNLQTNWEPLIFEVNKISLICRDDPPFDTFQIAQEIPLGRSII